jgi:hypothetical protein
VNHQKENAGNSYIDAPVHFNWVVLASSYSNSKFHD